MKKLKILDLFSGSGGLSLGLERTGGFETVAFCEIESYPIQLLDKHWPDVPIFNDIRKIKGKEIEERFGSIDLICGGFPCQPFSHAGKRKGINDDRHLWPEMLRLIEEIRPSWVIGENVAGLASMVERDRKIGVESRTGGKTAEGSDYDAAYLREEHMLFNGIIENLCDIDYDVQPFDIPAVGLNAQHKRARIWIIANSLRS